MTCRRIRTWLPDYVDGALPEKRARVVAEHLAGCPDCRAAAEQTERALAAFDAGGAALGEAGVDVEAALARVEARLVEQSEGALARRTASWWGWRVLAPIGGAVAAAALAVVLTRPEPPTGGLSAGNELAMLEDLALLEELELYEQMAMLEDNLDGLENLEVVLELDTLLPEVTDEG